MLQCRLSDGPHPAVCGKRKTRAQSVSQGSAQNPAIGQPSAALPPYGCRIPLVGKWICAEEESGEAPPAAEKASRFRGSGAIGGPEGAGNRNAATVCKGATERYEGCPSPQGVPNIAQFDPTTNGGRILPGTGTLPCPRKKGNPPRGTSQSHRPSPIYSAPREGKNAAPPRRGNTNSSRAGKGAKTRNFGGTDIEL